MKPGDTIPIKGIDVKVISAGGKVIDAPLAGAGQAGVDCAGFQMHDADTNENAQSVGVLITFGSFRMINMGDLTWNKEKDLVCPVNKIGKVDLYLVSHHGMNMSGSPQWVRSLAPKVALMNNGARKGGSPEIWQTIHDAPGHPGHMAIALCGDRRQGTQFGRYVHRQCRRDLRRQMAARGPQKDRTFKIYNKQK